MGTYQGRDLARYTRCYNKFKRYFIQAVRSQGFQFAGSYIFRFVGDEGRSVRLEGEGGEAAEGDVEDEV